MYIKKITIKNFRSIIDQAFESNSLNVIVGTNDIGKSNFLKALNLFFNNQTDIDRPFHFKDDFSHNAKHGKKQAKEITIEIEFIPPETYKGVEPVIWKKRWRKDGLQKADEFRYADGQEISGRTKVRAWLTSLKFKYVPAIKSEKYFENLLCDLHDTLSETIEIALKDAGKGFIDKIRDNTSSITKELFDRIGLESNIDLPDDLRSLFASLDFRTKSATSIISLKHRGDGIKVRHIPVILHFLAEQQSKGSTQGLTRVNTIWGFEEPENNLELTKCFELADNFLDYSKTIQVFITTHSPAFYSLVAKPNVNLFDIEYDNNKGSIINRSNSDLSKTIDSKMGLMPLVAPYVLEVKKDKEELETRLKTAEDEIAKINKPVLFVEGKIDKSIIEDVLKEFGDGLADKIIVETEKGAGHNWVKDRLHAWILTRKDIKSAGLFDNDKDALTSKKEIDDIIGRQKNPRVKTFRLSKPNHIIEIYKKGIEIPFGLEEMYPPFAWKHAQSQGWLEPRHDIIECNKFKDLEISFAKHCTNKGLTDEELLYLNKVKLEHKESFAKYIGGLKGEERKKILDSFKSLVDELKKFFNE